MKGKNYEWKTLWMTEGSAALAMGEDTMYEQTDPAGEAGNTMENQETFSEEEYGEYDELSCGGKIMCGMAALFEEFLLFLATGIRLDLTPPVTTLFLWIVLAVISAEAVRCWLSAEARRNDFPEE